MGGRSKCTTTTQLFNCVRREETYTITLYLISQPPEIKGVVGEFVGGMGVDAEMENHIFV